MAREPFLINPSKKAPRKRRKTPRKVSWAPPTKDRLGREGSKHRPTVYSYKGHWFTSSAAKIARPGTKLNPFKRRRKRKLFGNPLGASMTLVGLNPKGRRASMKRHKRRHKRNPAKSHRRRFKRNPQILATIKQFPVVPVAMGVGGALAVNSLPRMLGVDGLPKYGVQIAVIIGGGMGAKKFVNAAASEGWVIGSATMALYKLLGTIPGMAQVFQGLGIDEDSAYEAYAAYPDEIEDESYGAYVDESLEGMGYSMDYEYAPVM